MKKVLIITNLFFLLLLGWFLLPVDAAGDANNQVIVESITQITFNGTGGYRPDWSPDGGKIVFDKLEGNETNWVSAIWIVNADGTNSKQLTSNTSTNDNPKWSHDGKKILYSSQRGVWVMNSDGSEKKEVKKGIKPAWASGSDWTVKGKVSLVYCNSDDDCEFVIMNPDGTEEKKMFAKKFFLERPTWSPDGTKVAFADNRSGNWNIYVVDADGSNERQLTDETKDEWWPSWSPDGTKIVYHKFIQRHFDEKGNPKGDDFDIMVMNSDGSNKIKLNTEIGFQLFPSWSPDGKKIAYLKNGDIWVMNLKSPEIPAPATPASKSTPSFESLLAIASIGAAMVLRKWRGA